ncbi:MULTISPECIES: putative bifunctional diguanylate cyclase/phosphodiesterase [Mesorhizobium]|uniref:EAL domain-containing protein n=1 Tax=Mesorhizobium neociceri TaxID=1307853 RepID=A0A838B8Q1_9HYPH|nr:MULTISPECIES: EAL domain-containing protein [Mesorhizobium]MBA1142351.1 EAL domain-containing protein [Mesorhizobium neociceri]
MQRLSATRFGDLLAGDLRVFGGPSTIEPLAGRIRAEQVSIVLRNTLLGMVANILNAATFVMAVWGSPNQTKAILWASVIIIAAGFVGLRARSSFQSVKPRSVSRRTTQNLVRNAFLFGTWWGALPVLFFGGATSAAQVVITCLSAGMIAGGAASFYTIPIAAIAYTLPIFVGSAVAIVWVEGAVNLPVAILMVSYAITLFRAVLAHAFEFTQRFILQAESENAIRRDVLTRLPNRFSFNERLENALADAKQFDQHCALLLFDLNNFAQVNDRLGRAMADALLVEVAARLRRSTRESDGIARLEGGEFAIIATRDVRPDQIRFVAKQIVDAMRAPFLIEGREIYCRASIGIALAPADGLDANQLLRCVDTALHRAKTLGMGCSIQFFSANDDEAATRRHLLERDLTSALANDQLWLAFQPFLDLGSDRIRGYEALLRWQHPTLGPIPPSEFIPIAEQTGLIHAIGHWAVKTACLAAARWPRDLRVSVNFSVVQLKNKALLDAIVETLAEAGLEPRRLEVEITENVLISNFEETICLLQSLSSLSVTVALDDFGTGYSSLTYLRKLPLSRLKIDRSFVQDMLTDADCSAIVKSLVELAHELRIEVTAEGVETLDQLDYLRRVGCDEAQGYLIGKPGRIDDIPAIAARQFGVGS